MNPIVGYETSASVAYYVSYSNKRVRETVIWRKGVSVDVLGDRKIFSAKNTICGQLLQNEDVDSHLQAAIN